MEKVNANGGKKKRRKVAKALKDERFEAVVSNPLFDVLPNKRKKVVVDSRFKGMWKDGKFGSKVEIDMRGRPAASGSRGNDLQSLYSREEEASSSDSDDDSAESDDEPRRVDLARGNANLTSSDEDSDIGSSDEGDDAVVHDWGELDKDAGRVDWVSSRLALCNMEWDRVNATDIFVLLKSFTPLPPAAVLSVSIYISNFGKQRLKDEEEHGPQLPDLTDTVNVSDSPDMKVREALRAYQLERMRYYYAVVECDSSETAAAIYGSCDGTEFETSSVLLDLRFIPDEMVFEECDLKERATEETLNEATVKPKVFESVALSKSTTKLSWDETNPELTRAQKDAFDSDADLDEFQHLIAPCSSDEEADSKKNIATLLEAAGIQRRDAKLSEADEMPVTWDTDEVDVAVEQPETKAEKSDEPTPWQKYLQKRKLKKKERKAMIAELKKKKNEERENTEKDELGEKPSRAVKKKKREPQVTDGADVAADERFAALFSNSAFAIDQSNPLYRSSQLILKQAHEKKKHSREALGDEGSTAIADRLKKKAAKRLSKKPVA